MIKLNGVSKSYISKSKQTVDALKDVTFDFPDKGMVFILGKSGSGKSTLLNLLGGLDAPTDGEILIDGVSMKNFTPTDYDSYRNNYVGFIFQEYNLLEDFNVRDNIALALQLSKEEDVDEKVKDALYQVELNDDYLLRRVGEMSGGEKQRVAIARCIVKDSEMILADEPTGNLDSATGESIWNILKKVSQTKLVVVVSHDRESAEKFGDRVIEIADGKVISDSGDTTQIDKNLTPCDEKCDMGCKKREFTDARKRLPVRACLKMGLNNLAQRKVKTLSVILLSILTILVLLITEMFIAFSPEKTIAKFALRYDVPYFAVQQRLRDDEGHLNYLHIPTDGTIDYVGKNSDYILDGTVQNKQQVLDFGLTFVGEALELTPDSFYTTTDRIESCWKLGGSYFVDDGKKVALIEEIPLETLVGRRVYIEGLSSEDDIPILAGIIDTAAVDEKARDYFPYLFVRDDYEHGYHWSSSLLMNHIVSNVVMQFGDGKYQEYLQIDTDMPFGVNRGILTADKFLNEDEIRAMTLNDDEIVLTYELYATLFDAKSKFYYVNSDITDVNDGIEMPVELNQKFELKFYNSLSGDLLADLGEFKLAGIVFQSIYSQDAIQKNFQLVVNKRNCDKLQDYLDVTKTFLIKTDSVANLSKFLTELNSKHDAKVVYAGKVLYTDGINSKDIVEIVEEMIFTMQSLMFVMIAICIIMIAILLLLVINLISFNIANRKKEIGILSALGTSNSDITKIFLFETLVVATLSFVLTLILVFAVAAILNALISAGYTLMLTLFRVDVFTVMVLAVSSFGLLLLAAWIPTRKIAKLKPIDAIRQ